MIKRYFGSNNKSVNNSDSGNNNNNNNNSQAKQLDYNSSNDSITLGSNSKRLESENIDPFNSSPNIRLNTQLFGENLINSCCAFYTISTQTTLLLEILSFLTPHDLIRLSSTCKFFHHLSSADVVWSTHYYYLFPSSSLSSQFKSLTVEADKQFFDLHNRSKFSERSNPAQIKPISFDTITVAPSLLRRRFESRRYSSWYPTLLNLSPNVYTNTLNSFSPSNLIPINILIIPFYRSHIKHDDLIDLIVKRHLIQFESILNQKFNKLNKKTDANSPPPNFLDSNEIYENKEKHFLTLQRIITEQDTEGWGREVDVQTNFYFETKKPSNSKRHQQRNNVRNRINNGHVDLWVLLIKLKGKYYKEEKNRNEDREKEEDDMSEEWLEMKQRFGSRKEREEIPGMVWVMGAESDREAGRIGKMVGAKWSCGIGAKGEMLYEAVEVGCKLAMYDLK